MRPVFLIALLLGMPALADEPDPNAPHSETDGGTVSATFENDIFGGTDRHYTNGVRLDYVTPRNNMPWLGRAMRRQLGWLTDADDWYSTFSIGQNIYTPANILRRNPNPNDRPYAGFTYVSFGVAADRGNRLDTIAIDLGVVGEAAQADDIQRLVHEVIGADDPRGWDSQLKNEPGVRLLFERKYRYGYDFDLALFDLEVDAAPHFGLALGNVDTSAAAGLTVRVGDQLDDNYGPPRVRPAVAGPGFFEPIDGVGWYLFAGTEARAVGRNIFLEGNTFRDSPSVDPHRVVADLQAGFALQFDEFEVTYTHVFRTPEFQGQQGFAQFGSLNVAARF